MGFKAMRLRSISLGVLLYAKQEKQAGVAFVSAPFGFVIIQLMAVVRGGGCFGGTAVVTTGIKVRQGGIQAIGMRFAGPLRVLISDGRITS